jgi:GWxTD domain-containing protein
MKATYIFISFFTILCFFTAKGQNTALNVRDLNPYVSNKNTQVRVIHYTDSSFLTVETSQTNFSISIKIYDEYDNKKLLFEQFIVSSNLIMINNQTKIFLPVAEQKKLWAVEVHIVANDFDYKNILLANRAQENEQSIFIHQNNTLIVQKYIATAQPYTLTARSPTVNQFYLKYFAEPITAAKAIYITEQQTFNPLKGYEELIVVPANKNFILNKQGVYFIQTDSNSNKGSFIFATDAEYPKATQLIDLLAPIRYISKDKEYDKINMGADKKAELDAFWLQRSADKEQAKRIFKLYYERVKDANYYFTVYKEGWKSDKGIVFVVFGTPDVVRKFANQEIWYYKNQSYRQPVEFVFDRVGELYYLQRNKFYREIWNAEIERWRKGKL